MIFKFGIVYLNSDKIIKIHFIKGKGQYGIRIHYQDGSDSGYEDVLHESLQDAEEDLNDLLLLLSTGNLLK